MHLNRRDLLRGLGTLAAATALTRLEASQPGGIHPEARTQGPEFPRKADFRIAEGYSYINGAYTHPMPIAAAEAYHRAVDRRSSLAPAASPLPGQRVDPRVAFASLINAKPSEISYIPNTSTGENLVVECLGIHRFDGNVVTDALHFEGALVHLYELQKQGLDLRVVTPNEGRIELKDRGSRCGSLRRPPVRSRLRSIGDLQVAHG